MNSADIALQPQPIALSPHGAGLARCTLCGQPTGSTAWWLGTLRGLYCSRDHCAAALLVPPCRVGVPYRSLPAPRSPEVW